MARPLATSDLTNSGSTPSLAATNAISSEMMPWRAKDICSGAHTHTHKSYMCGHKHAQGAPQAARMDKHGCIHQPTYLCVRACVCVCVHVCVLCALPYLGDATGWWVGHTCLHPGLTKLGETLTWVEALHRCIGQKPQIILLWCAQTYRSDSDCREYIG